MRYSTTVTYRGPSGHIGGVGDGADTLEHARERVLDAIDYHTRRILEVTDHANAIVEAYIEEICQHCEGRGWIHKGRCSRKCRGAYVPHYTARQDCPKCEGQPYTRVWEGMPIPA